MQSHLTRRVFQAILENEPLRFSHCQRRVLHVTSASIPRVFSRHGPYHVSKRGLFAFPSPLPSVDRAPAIASEAGLKPMRDLLRSLGDKSRPPASDTLAEAFRDFFRWRVDSPGVITDFHARLLAVTWKYLKTQQEQLGADRWHAVFSNENLEMVLFVFSKATCPPESRDTVQKVARFAFLELCADRGESHIEISHQALIAYITLLSSNGNPDEARHVTQKYWYKLCRSKPSPWLLVMKGFAMTGDRRQLRKLTEELEKRGNKFDRDSHRELTTVLIQQGLVDAVKAIYDCPISGGSEPAAATKDAIIKFAILKGDLSWAKEVFQTLPRGLSPEKRDVTLLLEAAQGNGASELSQRLKIWADGAPKILHALDISCVNNLIEYANSIREPQLASDFAGLAAQWSLQPDTRTNMLQLESRIQARDINGALACLHNVPVIGSMVDTNLPLVNKLISMLCLSGHTDALFEQISNLLDPVIDNNIRLEADTIAALTHFLLYRHDWDAVSELLRPRLSSYDTEERARIRQSLTKFIMDTDQENDHVWEAYNLLRVAFPETGVSSRADIMTALFRRDRSDLACLVFGHMRQTENLAQRPKPDTYARCFQGIARAADASNLEVVHNMLKLDLEVDLNTRVRNALMLAYAACQQPERSMEVFREILQSEEGPSHKTITVFFRACETHHNGVDEAKKMMQKAKLLDIVVDRQMYTTYIEALAAQCEVKQATEAVEKMQSQIGYNPTYNTIGLLYNAIPHQHFKDEVEGWAKATYPELWMQLSKQVPQAEHDENGPQFDGIRNEISV